MSQQRCITNRVLVALSTLVCLCGPLVPGVSSFFDISRSKLTSSRISDPASRITGTYDEVGNLKSVNYPNAIKHQYTYNALNRLDLLIDRSPTNSIINCWKYHATGAGQRTWVEEFDHRTAWYTYDSLGWLKTEAVTGSIQDGNPDRSGAGNGNVTYGYDNVGNRQNRTSSLTGITNQAFGYDANDRLNGDQYDSNGNTRNAPVSQPTTLNSQQLLGTDDYDSENRLTQRTGTTGSNVTLVYDGDGNRVQQTVNGQTTSYLIDDRNLTGYAQVVEELVNPDQSGAGGSVNHTYTYGHDLISQDQVALGTNTWHATFYAYDGHGNVRFLTNESGAVTDTYVYDAFGTERALQKQRWSAGPPSPIRARLVAVRPRDETAVGRIRYQPERRLEDRSAPVIRRRQDAALSRRSSQGTSAGSLPAAHTRQPYSRLRGEAGDDVILIRRRMPEHTRARLFSCAMESRPNRKVLQSNRRRLR